MNFLWLNHWQPEVDNPRGRFQFASGPTSLNGTGAQTGNFYNQYASFLLGLVSNARKSIQHELLTGREWQHGLFIRDRWQASPKLTFDLGLRWEYYPIMQRADRGIERVDLDTLEVLLGGRGGNPTDLGFSAGKDNFAPRVGAIYRLNDSNVFRDGIRHHLQPAAVDAADAWTVSAHDRRELPAELAVQLVQQARPGHSDDRAPRSEHRTLAASERGVHANPQAR